MGIRFSRLCLQYRIIALVSDYRSEISLQYTVYSVRENELARIGLVGQAGVVLACF